MSTLTLNQLSSGEKRTGPVSAYTTEGISTRFLVETATEHGFTANTAVTLSGGVFVKAAATKDNMLLFLVTEIVGKQSFIAGTDGFVTTSGLTNDTVYYLSATPGALTTVKPSTYVYPVLYNSGTSGHILLGRPDNYATLNSLIGSYGTRITAVEGVNTAQNNRLSSLEGVSTAQNNRLTALESSGNATLLRITLNGVISPNVGYLTGNTIVHNLNKTAVSFYYGDDLGNDGNVGWDTSQYFSVYSLDTNRVAVTFSITSSVPAAIKNFSTVLV